MCYLSFLERNKQGKKTYQIQNSFLDNIKKYSFSTRENQNFVENFCKTYHMFICVFSIFNGEKIQLGFIFKKK